MSSNTKSLVKDSFIYGGTSILAKMINWLMTYLFTYTLIESDYGIMTNLYAYVALIIVFLTFGMETGFFRFANKEKHNPTHVYSTAIFIVGGIVALFLFVFLNFLPQIRPLIWSDEIPDFYIRLVIIILSMDAFSAIPFAYLRYKKKAKRFGALKLLNVVLYSILCIFFLAICPYINERNPELIAWFYNPEMKLGYVFISNLIATGIQTACLLPELTGFRYVFDWKLARQMFKYCFPLVLMGLAGMSNQVIDKILFPIVFPGDDEAFKQLGLYSACFKIALIMMMFTQAFRYAYEPFMFEKSKDLDAKESYAKIMKYFIILGLLVFLGVSFYLDIIKNLLLHPRYFSALGIVPIVLIGELFFAVYFNLSVWYKLSDKTHWGALFSTIGCIIIIAINIIFIPKIGYWACAWASFAGNGVIMLLSYLVGQKYYPIRYDLKTIGLYTALAILLYAISYFVPIENEWAHIAFNTVLIAIYIGILIRRDLPLKEIPFVNRFIK